MRPSRCVNFTNHIASFQFMRAPFSYPSAVFYHHCLPASLQLDRSIIIDTNSHNGSPL